MTEIIYTILFLTIEQSLILFDEELATAPLMS